MDWLFGFWVLEINLDLERLALSIETINFVEVFVEEALVREVQSSAFDFPRLMIDNLFFLNHVYELMMNLFMIIEKVNKEHLIGDKATVDVGFWKVRYR